MHRKGKATTSQKINANRTVRTTGQLGRQNRDGAMREHGLGGILRSIISAVVPLVTGTGAWLSTPAWLWTAGGHLAALWQMEPVIIRTQTQVLSFKFFDLVNCLVETQWLHVTDMEN